MVAQQIVNGLSLGMAYALIAIGFSMIFGIVNLINFAQGNVYAFGAYMAFLFIGLNFGLLPSIILSVIVTGLLGILINTVGLEPLRKKNSVPIASLITTVGIGYIIQNMLAILFGSERKPFPEIFTFINNFNIFGVVIQGSAIGVLVVSVLLLLVLTLIVNGTKIGLAMKAVQQNPKAAVIIGINVNMVVAFAFFASSVSAAIAGVLIGSYYQIIYPGMGFMVGLKGFAASILGGIDVLHGSVAGGLIVGVSESLAAAFLGGTYRDVVAFVILILVLIVKPAGIFGRKGITKV